jgi:6-pyruvoyltetrahydropterin/6-carboxytetrahydropterin synthase
MVVPDEEAVEVHEVKKSFHFEAAHRLPHHGGKCARLHGHSYRMTVTLRGTELACGTGPSSGMLQDHADVSTALMPIIQSNLDHYYLNESTGLENPTVELLCRWIWDKIAKKLPRLYSITIRETCTAAYTYRRARSE